MCTKNTIQYKYLYLFEAFKHILRLNTPYQNINAYFLKLPINNETNFPLKILVSVSGPVLPLPRNTHRRGSISKPGWFRKGNVSGVGMARREAELGEWGEALVSCRHQLPARVALRHLFLRGNWTILDGGRGKDFIKDEKNVENI